MRTELRVKPHTVLIGQSVYELWHNGEFIGQVTGADGAGVRVISKHPLTVTHTSGDGTAAQPDVVTVKLANP
jgi:hypothetical protein